MLKSTEAYDKLEYDLLKLINEHSSDFLKHCKANALDLHDVLLKMQKDELLLGLKELKLEGEKLNTSFSNLRLTYAGLEILEAVKKEYNWG